MCSAGDKINMKSRFANMRFLVRATGADRAQRGGPESGDQQLGRGRGGAGEEEEEGGHIGGSRHQRSSERVSAGGAEHGGRAEQQDRGLLLGFGQESHTADHTPSRRYV